MFALAGAFDFVDGGAVGRHATAMLDAWPTVPSDGRAVLAANHAAVGVLRWAVVERDRHVVPIWDSERQLLIAGDVRLYNRSDLARDLDLPGGWQRETDLSLAARAFHRWHWECPRHLRGDFALVVWDERNRSLFAARDHLGVRPLFHHHHGDSLMVASDVSQFFPLMSRPFDQIDDSMILERFSRIIRTHERTYFRNISQLAPGCAAVFESGCRRIWRYWSPPIGRSAHRPYRDACHEFEYLFEQAVNARLESDYPLVAHSSGGFDSSSIVMMANQAYRTDARRPPLVTVSALTIGMECDDTLYMDAVARDSSFESIRWNALAPSLSEIEDPHSSGPGARRGIGGGPRGEFVLAHQRGARVLLTGVTGDTVTYAFGILRDLFGRGHIDQLLRETVLRTPRLSSIRNIARAALGFLRPAHALRWSERLFSRAGPPPLWMGPRLRQLYPPPLPELDIPDVDWDSHLQCELWARITGSQFASTVNAAVLRGTLEGVEVRIPFADVRLIEHIFSVPWSERVPQGDFRRLARDALRRLLPPEFENRLDQGSWSGVWAATARNQLALVRQMTDDGMWLSAPYVDLGQAQAMVRSATSGIRTSPLTVVLAAEFGILEAWLRKVFRYDSRPEVDHVRSS